MPKDYPESVNEVVVGLKSIVSLTTKKVAFILVQ